MHKSKGQAALLHDQPEEALMHFRRAMSTNFDMILKLIETLKQHDIQYLVAPYEADAQLAWLSRHDVIDVVISEDSDCLAYGCKRVWHPRMSVLFHIMHNIVIRLSSSLSWMEMDRKSRGKI